MTLRIIATGGTFDKHYNEIDGQLGFSESHLPQIVARARLTDVPVIELLPLQDSVDMRDSDRARVLASCHAATENSIVIVHGTDTMRETAQVLGAAHANSLTSKSIVITGAMIPYDIRNSDALFNLGFAFAAAQLLAPGVYVAMNGQTFGWERVKKDRAAGVFRSD
ncbi:MAG: asparaginase domain-containing protein [Burkholderiaceae bacterium]|jgi:L-asparaginase